MTANLSNPIAWIAAFAGLIFLGSAMTYIRHATSLADYINRRCPELWGKLLPSWSAPNPLRPYYRARRLEWLVIFNAGSADRPDDPEFKSHLEQARWAIAICGLAFLALTIAIGRIDTP